MYVARLFTVILIVLSASLSGAMAAGQADRAAEASAAVPADHETCCTDGMERLHGCHVGPALLPAAAVDTRAQGLVRSVTLMTLSLPDLSIRRARCDISRALSVRMS
jgi:hypothetical protein